MSNAYDLWLQRHLDDDYGPEPTDEDMESARDSILDNVESFGFGKFMESETAAISIIQIVQLLMKKGVPTSSFDRFHLIRLIEELDSEFTKVIRKTEEFQTASYNCMLARHEEDRLNAEDARISE